MEAVVRSSARAAGASLVLAAALVLASAGAVARDPWAPPLGIPAPSFGLQAVPAAVTHYVDVSHPAATDDNNPNGTPAKPRATIPDELSAGSVVEVRGGPYNYTQGPTRWVGTAQSPIFIVGVGMPRFPRGLEVYDDPGRPSRGAYVILDGLDLHSLAINQPYHHVALRNSAVRGDPRKGGIGIASYSPAVPVTDVLIFRNRVLDNGDLNTTSDQDVHGITVNARVSNLWVLENELARNSGDGIQINAGSRANQPTVHHIYVARNVAHHNRQTGFWTKQAEHVVFSQNVSYAHPRGAAMGFQYGPENVWFLFNHAYDSAFGIAGMSTSGLGSGTRIYVVGNLIHGIHHGAASYNPNTAWSNAGIMLASSEREKYILNNTLFDVDGGVNGPGSGTFYIENNIISTVTEAQGHAVFIEPPGAAGSTLRNNLFHQPAGPLRIRWDQRVYDLPDLEAALGGRATGSRLGDPRFLDAASGDFRLGSSSPAIDAGSPATVEQVFRTFEQLYGLGIRVDFDGRPRPLGGRYDLGAFEARD
jgi:hypothetical protein